VRKRVAKNSPGFDEYRSKASVKHLLKISSPINARRAARINANVAGSSRSLPAHCRETLRPSTPGYLDVFGWSRRTWATCGCARSARPILTACCVPWLIAGAFA